MAVEESLADYLRKKRDESERQQKNIDWEGRRTKWQNAVRSLYQDIEQWLREAIDQKIVTVDYVPKTIEEEYIGPYDIDILRLNVGAEKVVFEPGGTLVLGAD